MKTGLLVLLMIAMAATSITEMAAAAERVSGNSANTPVSTMGEDSNADSLMNVARAEMAASNRHDLEAFMREFTSDAVILADASPYSYRGNAGFTYFFKHSGLGSSVQYSIKPGAPQTEDRAGDHAYLEMVVNIRATDDKGDSFNDPIHWIGVLVRENGVWKITGLTLTTIGG